MSCPTYGAVNERIWCPECRDVAVWGCAPTFQIEYHFPVECRKCGCQFYNDPTFGGGIQFDGIYQDNVAIVKHGTTWSRYGIEPRMRVDGRRGGFGLGWINFSRGFSLELLLGPLIVDLDFYFKGDGLPQAKY